MGNRKAGVAVILIGMLVGSVLLVGCGTATSTPTGVAPTGVAPTEVATVAAPTEATPTSLTVLDTASPSIVGLKQVAAAYTAKTGIKINFVDVPSTQLATKIILAKSANKATFDIAQLNGPDLPVVVQAGAFLSLDSYIDGDAAYNKGDFPQGILDYCKQDGVSYSIPLSTEPFLHWYRTDLYTSAGLTPPTTWDQLIANAATFKNGGNYGFATAYGPASAATYFSQMLYTSGGRVLDPNTYEPLLNTPYVKSVMAKFLSLKPYLPASSTGGASADMITAFSQLNVASIMAASGWYSTVNSPTNSKVVGKFQTAAPLTGTGGSYPVASPLFGWLLGISPVSPYKKASWDFLSFALGSANVQAFVDAGAPPVARTSTVTNADLIKKMPFLPAVQKAVDSPTVLPRIPEWTQIATLLSQDISAMATGQLTLDAGMDKANSDITDVLVRAGRYKG